MSYILDALNKSEQEKNRQPPGLDTVHAMARADDTRESRMPLWITLGVIVLLINVGVIGYLLTRSPAEPVAQTAPVTTAPTPQPRAPAPAPPAPVPAPVQPAASSETVITPQSIPARSTPPAEEAEVVPVRVAALPASVQRQIPDMRFSSHIFADAADLRMVSINGKSVREGDVVAEGIRLVEITEEGVVLTFRHYTFEMSVLRDWSFD